MLNGTKQYFKKSGIILLALLLVSGIAGCSSKNAPTGNDPQKVADDYPNKPITWVIPFDPGSGADIFARTLGKSVEKNLGQNFVYLNKPGGSGGIALSYLKSQPTDGYTIGSHSSTMVYSIASKSIPYKIDDVSYIARINADPEVLAVPGNSPFKTLEDFIAYAKANPGKLKVAGVGAFSTASAVSDQLKAKAAIQYDYVPYQGGNEAAVAILGSNVDAGWYTSSNVRNYLESGKVRLLALATKDQDPSLKGVPTLKEKGFDIEMILWRGIIAIPGMPEARVKKLEDAFAKAMTDPDWLKYMEQEKQVEAYLPSKEFTEAVKTENTLAEKATTTQKK
ncbi:tripartite tricarboxylate transporter substrate binding protein [Desulfosporosinus burensis]